MKKAGALANALRSSGAAVASHVPVAEAPALPSASPAVAKDRAAPVQPSRLGTKAITVHFPEEVRRQLKTMAAEQGRNIEDMLGEALNLLFVKYRKAELAPRKAIK